MFYHASANFFEYLSDSVKIINELHVYYSEKDNFGDNFYPYYDLYF